MILVKLYRIRREAVITNKIVGAGVSTLEVRQ